jgi:hypothetical protein
MGTSHQRGWVTVRGKKWYGYFRRIVLDPKTNQSKAVATPVALGLKSQMTKFEAREKLDLEIARLTGHTTEDGVVKNGSVTLHCLSATVICRSKRRIGKKRLQRPRSI